LAPGDTTCLRSGNFADQQGHLMASKRKLREFIKAQSGGLVNALLLVAIVVGVSAFQSRNMLSTSATMAPPLNGPLLRGGSYELTDADRRPELVYFFAPWCKFCALSSDNLVRLRRLRADDSLEILTVALGWQDQEEVRDYVDRHGLKLPVVLGDRRLAEDWQVYAFPTYYVLDSNHRIRRRDLGYSTQFGLWWRTWIVN
jgi:thiol-disulfide isomerase/thioredoxin